MLRRAAFNGAYGRLRMLYALEDPWDMASAREQHRFTETTHRLSAIARHFGTLLELGCGEGHQSVHLRALTDKLYGVDVSARAVDRARKRCTDAQFVTGDLESVPRLFEAAHFDLI